MSNPQKLSNQSRWPRLFDLLQAPFVALDRLMEAHLPPSMNPFAQTGALANVSFIIAAISGVLLLFWYSPSVHEAWASLENMSALGQLTRSVHRYSSDATMLLVLFHAAKLLFASRFSGPRWVAWVTGVFSLGTLWFVGWLGYWLVWDSRAQSLATISARLVEPIPIFTDPLSRTFVVNEAVSSGLFVTVFFFHMLIPLVIGVAIWMHISRVARAKFLTSKPMGAWLGASLLAVSIAFPALSSEQADMSIKPAFETMDWWYLFPLAVADRLDTGVIWSAVFVLGLLLFTIPWTLSRKEPEKAQVDLNRCNGCTNCANDCPYGAITMVPRTDGRPWELEAKVDPNLCVGCTICSGSCNSAGIGIPSLPVQDKRKVVDQWVDQVQNDGEEPLIAFLCANSAAGDFSIDENGVSTELPGFRCVQVPCSGWVNPITVERALRRGAKGVLVVGCGCSDPPFREGVEFTQDRLDAKRAPQMRLEKVDTSRVRFILHPRGDLVSMLADIDAYRKDSLAKPSGFKVQPKHWVKGVLVAATLSALVWAPSNMASLFEADPSPELVLSMKYRPKVEELCRPATEEEKAKMMRHMKSDTICERSRPDVNVRVSVGPSVVHQATYEPHGLASDGPSFALIKIPVGEGEHQVKIEVGHADRWTHVKEAQLVFRQMERHVFTFEEGVWTLSSPNSPRK